MFFKGRLVDDPGIAWSAIEIKWRMRPKNYFELEEHLSLDEIEELRGMSEKALLFFLPSLFRSWEKKRCFVDEEDTTYFLKAVNFIRTKFPASNEIQMLAQKLAKLYEE